jgi:RNA recognition motif-containing protein
LPSTDEAMRNIERRAAEPRGGVAIPCRLFVGGLGTTITEAMLREAFGAFGKVADAVVMVDRGTGQSRGFGFVTMQNRKDASAAVEALDGSELNGRRIGVNVATDRARSSLPPRPRHSRRRRKVSGRRANQARRGDPQRSVELGDGALLIPSAVP